MSGDPVGDFMVSAGAFAVGGCERRPEEIARLMHHLAAVRRHLTAPCDRSVGHAVAAIGRDGATEYRIGRLMTALAGRMAILASEKPVLAPARARLPYKDD